MNRDQMKGRIKETKGKAKQIAGNIVGNRRLEEKGRMQKNLGKVQAAYGDVKNDLKKGA